ncbi:bis-aminopropyl spermidine synthase family protein [Nocardiopsis sediminis]|uniref:Bis-aminopropyl spermidine synthase family protein n=1 Tax=Nocardiopsis sediminis TaxID=1778267 RepID=A0ABV8FR04_9ACTN
MTDHPPGLAGLLTEQGIDAPRIHLVLAALSDGAWWTPRELVRATTVAHRLVDATLTALGAGLEHNGDRVRLVRPGDYAGFARPAPADPLAPLLAGHADAAAELRRLVDEAPPPLADLDHVTATADTALRRGVHLATRFALPGARLLCVGDHDLTSLATTLVSPGAEAVVVDIDERMLDYIDRAADRLGLPVACHFADLRLGLPASVARSCDLVFTDPPYTPEGVELFVRRGLEGLTDPRRGRILVAYGASETTPGLVARTQARLARMNLVFEAVLPDFNRYLGAEAIGAASDLYVLRPTTRTPAAATGGGAAAARVYSQGANAKEATGGLGEAGARAVVEAATPDTVAGAWPRDAVPEGVLRVDLADWMAAPTEAGCAAVDLTGGWDALLGRAVLAGAAGETHVVVASRAPQVRDAAGQQALRAMLEPRFELRFLRNTPGPRGTVVVAQLTDRGATAPEDRLLWHCQDRAHGSLPATLREGLIAIAAESGRPVNKKTARTRVAAEVPWASGHTLLDLPAHRFPALREAARRLVGGLAEPAEVADAAD